MLDNRGEQEDSQQNEPLNVNNSKYDTPVSGTTGAGIAENKENNINIGFVLGHTVTIALGFA